MNFCKFLVGKNCVSSMIEGYPWDWAPPADSKIPTVPKKTRREMMNYPTTEWLVYSAVKPAIVNQRVGAENPPDELRGIVVDYDTKQDIDTVCTLLDQMPDKSLLPQFIDVSLSGKVHAVWVFEKALKVAGMEHCVEVLHSLLQLLGAPTLLAGYDMQGGRAVAERPWVPITSGTAWYTINPEPFPHSVAMGTLIEVGRRTKLFSKNAVPLDKIAEEVEKRWPGRWLGEFKVGEVGVRFWDPNADNATGCQIKPDGLLCFTGEKPFVYWSDLLGSTWVDLAKRSQLANAIKGLYFDGREYWELEREPDVWKCISRVDMILRLGVRGVSFVVPKGETTSMGNVCLEAIQKQNYVDRVTPMVGYPPGISRIDNLITLNTAKLFPTQGVLGPTGTPEDFPFIWDLMTGLFVTQPWDNENIPQHTFLAWLKRAREAICYYHRTKGQAVFLCGPKNIGKNLLIDGICQPLLGGAQVNPFPYFTGKAPFNSQIFSSGLLAINDQEAPEDYNRPMFLAKVKSFVVNNEHDVHTKFKVSSQTRWYGRLMASMNDDFGSEALLPEVCKNTMDKMIFLLCKKYRDFTAATERKNSEILEKELPFFAHWLDNIYVVPDRVWEGGRCGVRSYFDPTLLAHSTQQHFSYNLSELIASWMAVDSYWDHSADRNAWAGSPTDLLSALHLCEPVREIAREWTTSKVLKALSGLAKIQDSGIEFIGDVGRDFRITKSVLLDYKKTKPNELLLKELK